MTLHKSLREDLGIVEQSLRFVNELLRSLLDTQRASTGHLTLVLTPVDLLRDIFEPVQSMVYVRDMNFEVQIDCPEGLVVLADRLRLQQVILVRYVFFRLTRRSSRRLFLSLVVC